MSNPTRRRFATNHNLKRMTWQEKYRRAVLRQLREIRRLRRQLHGEL